MRLTDLPGQILTDVTRKWRRRAVVGVVAAICLLGIAVEGVGAIRAALEPAWGPVGARLILAAAFAVIIAIAAAVLAIMERQRDPKEDTMAGAVERNVKTDDRTVLIAEAIDLGYSLARGFKRRAEPANSAKGAPEACDDRPRAASRDAAE